MTGFVDSFYQKALRPFLFALPPEQAHALGMRALRAAGMVRGVWSSAFSVKDPRLVVRLGEGDRSIQFPNPVGLAAGFDKDGEALWPLEGLGFGFLEAGTITPQAQPGNSGSRLFRFPNEEAIVNRMGFNNHGAAALAARLSGGRRLAIPLGINIGKNKDTPNERAVDDYFACLKAFFTYARFFVVNVSSPNTPGLRDLQTPRVLAPLLTTLREQTDRLMADRGASRRPLLFVKISPDELAPEALAETALAAGFDGVVAVNTTKDRNGLPFDAPLEGGASGRPLARRATEVIRRIRRAVGPRLAIIGVGGIFNADDAYEKILAGASLVEVYTGFVYRGPFLVKQILTGLVERLARDGFRSVSDAVGQK